MDVDRVAPLGPPGQAAPVARNRPAAEGFGEALQGALGDLSLSRHAQHRIDRRDLSLDTATAERLNAAVHRAAEKGARTSVVMLDNLAVVVDVRQRTVVTAMNQAGGEGRVFTNIDSVVIG